METTFTSVVFDSSRARSTLPEVKWGEGFWRSVEGRCAVEICPENSITILHNPNEGALGRVHEASHVLSVVRYESDFWQLRCWSLLHDPLDAITHLAEIPLTWVDSVEFDRNTGAELHSVALTDFKPGQERCSKPISVLLGQNCTLRHWIWEEPYAVCPRATRCIAPSDLRPTSNNLVIKWLKLSGLCFLRNHSSTMTLAILGDDPRMDQPFILLTLHLLSFKRSSVPSFFFLLFFLFLFLTLEIWRFCFEPFLNVFF